MMKRAISVFLAMLMLSFAVPVFAAGASTEISSEEAVAVAREALNAQDAKLLRAVKTFYVSYFVYEIEFYKRLDMRCSCRVSCETGEVTAQHTEQTDTLCEKIDLLFSILKQRLIDSLF